VILASHSSDIRAVLPLIIVDVVVLSCLIVLVTAQLILLFWGIIAILFLCLGTNLRTTVRGS
jgi:hypothetical protein